MGSFFIFSKKNKKLQKVYSKFGRHWQKANFEPIGKIVYDILILSLHKKLPKSVFVYWPKKYPQWGFETSLP